MMVSLDGLLVRGSTRGSTVRLSSRPKPQGSEATDVFDPAEALLNSLQTAEKV